MSVLDMEDERKKTVFVRQATGLVREVGAWPSFMATIMMVTGGVIVLWVALMYEAPGANWPAAFTIAFLPNLMMAGMFTIVGISMPRAGGDYVFTSRALHPFLGFINYWGIAWAFIIQIGIFSYYTASYFGYVLTGLGVYYHSANLANFGAYLTGPNLTLVIGILVAIASTTMANMLRPRITWGLMFWGAFIALVSTAIMFAVLSTFNTSTFQASYNSFMSNSSAYSSVISQGGITPPSNAFVATAAALPIVWFYYSWFNLPTSWGGEMKNVKKSMPIAITVGLTATFIYYIFMSTTVTHAFGQSFLENWGSLAAAGKSPIPGIGGFIPFFALLVEHNIALYIIMFLALFLPTFLELPPLVIGTTRYIFAWAFDRVLPDKMSSVSDRIRTPLYATALVFGGTLATIGIMAFYSNSGEFATLSFTMFSFGFIIPAIAAIIIPFYKKDLYESTFVAKKKYLLPLISWLGLGTSGYLIYSVYLSSQTGALPIDTTSITMYGTIYGVGILIYIVAYFRNRARGVPIDLVFKEIPPE
jgi:APA family basic amino acid/polyamine antiporter